MWNWWLNLSINAVFSFICDCRIRVLTNIMSEMKMRMMVMNGKTVALLTTKCWQALLHPRPYWAAKESCDDDDNY